MSTPTTPKSCPQTLPNTDTANPDKQNKSSSKQQARQTHYDVLWHSRLEELKEYKKMYGHVNVPRKSSKLGEWCNSQRKQIRAYNNNEPGPLTKERKDKLDALGFEWIRKRKNSDAAEMPTKKSRGNEDQGGLSKSLAFVRTAPNTGHCEWTFNRETRVLLAKSIGKRDFLCEEDESFMMRAMERTDIALVIEGILRNKSPLLDLQYIAKRAKGNIHHRCQHFTVARKEQDCFDAEHASTVPEPVEKPAHQQRFAVPSEKAVNRSIEISDYIEYIDKYRNATGQENLVEEKAFQFSTMPGEKFYPSVDHFFLVDIDMQKILPEACSDFRNHFLLRKCLPGGDACMMKSVSSHGQPSMGPNLHIGTPGSSIHFHRAGEGTVDSGHFCVNGFIEVVMLGRMTEEKTQQALQYLCPHHKSKKIVWPDYESIRKCKDMNYDPCVFVLKPGQFLHVNKGRIYAFRSASSASLDANDCHKNLRNELIENKMITSESICKMIAWDWMYLGATKEGIQREISETLTNARLAQKNEVQPLAIPERCIIAIASHHLACYEVRPCWYGGLLPSHLTILKGIYPGLKDIIECQINEFNEKIKASKTDTYVEVLSLSDAKKDPDRATIDPFGNDFNCKLCKKELSNTYMHCEGCEILLQKDFNICTDCHANDTRRLKNVTMHPTRPYGGGKNTGKRADYNHMPGTTKDKQHNCGCRNGPPCRQCGYMICCSCKCHKKYSLRTRFRDGSEIKSLLNCVQLAIGIEIGDIDSSVEGNEDGGNIFDATAYASTETQGGTSVPEISSVDIAVQLNSNEDDEMDISQNGVRRKLSATVSKSFLSKQDISKIIDDKKQEIDERIEKKIRELDSRRKVSERRFEVTSMTNIREMIKKEMQDIGFPKDIEILKRKVEEIVENEEVTERKMREIQARKDKAVEVLQQEVKYIKSNKERSLLEYQRQVRELGEKVQQLIGKESSIHKPDPPG